MFLRVNPRHPFAPPRRCRGGVSPLLLLSVTSLVAIVGLVIAGLTLRGEGPLSTASSANGPTAGDRPLRLYCAAGLRVPTQEVLDAYEQAYGVKVELHTHGSGTLFGQIRTEHKSGQGPDLYLTAEQTYNDQGQQLGLIAEVIPIGTQRPVIIVAPGNPKHISALADFVDPDRQVAFGVANEGTAIGKKTRRIAEHMGIRAAIQSQRKTEQETVIALAEAVALGSLDAAVVWDTTAMMTDGVEVVPTDDPAFALGVSRISVGVTTVTDRPTEALRLARFITAHDRGLAVYRRYGFDVVDGDGWDEHPDLVVYCGSMFEAVFAESIAQFNQREGVTIRPQWAGCGKLVAQMKVIDDPDLFPQAYLACDAQFLDRVQDQFGERTIVSQNPIVLAVQQGNPHGIATPADLLRPGLRVGVCHPEDSALGHLTKNMLSDPRFGGIYPRLEQSRTLEVDTGPTLVSQILTGGLDAVIVYRSNVMANPANLNKLEVIAIDDAGTGLSTATQPWAIAKQARHRQLMQRLFDTLKSEPSAERFRAAGFQWQAD